MNTSNLLKHNKEFYYNLVLTNKARYAVADYHLSHSKDIEKNLVCCTYMDKHTDPNETDSGYYYFVFAYFDQSCAVVYREDKQLKMITPDYGDLVKIKVIHNHALYPKELAKEVVKHQSWAIARKHDKAYLSRQRLSKENDEHFGTIRAIWKFITKEEFDKGE